MTPRETRPLNADAPADTAATGLAEPAGVVARPRRAEGPLASFVVAAFNAEATLARTLRSLGRQTMPSWEAIVVDDGSTDGTGRLAAAWSRHDPRVRLVRQVNRGASAARNTGLAAASGTFVAFVDADDTIAPSYLSRLIRAATRDGGADAACSGSVRLSRAGRVIERSRPDEVEHDLLAGVRWRVPAPLHALLVRRSVAMTAGGFDDAFAANEDWDFWFRLAQSGLRVAREDAPLAHYWCRAGSLTRNGPAMIRSYRSALERVHRLAPGSDPATEDHEIRLALATSLSWNGAVAIGQGHGTADIVDAAFEDPRLRGRIDAPLLAPSFLGGLTAGAECARDAHADLWPALSALCEGFFAAFESRSGSDGLAYGMRKACEREVVRASRHKRRVRPLGNSIGLPLISAALVRGIAVRDGQDSLVMTLPGAGRTLSVPVLGTRLEGATLRTRIQQGGYAELTRFLSAKPSAARIEPLLERIDGTIRPLAKRLRHGLGRRVGDGIRREAPASGHAETTPPPAAAGFAPTGEDAADAIIRDEAASVLRSMRPPSVAPRAKRRDEPADASGALWDAFYRDPDPWGYDTPYEQLKYDRTLAILPDGEAIGRALELACAEGRFTERLAPRVASLTAADISTVALARAAERCARFPNVAYRPINFFEDEIGLGWDLITASEVLYYMTGVEQLRRFASRVAGGLARGGLFVHAHGFSVDDDPSRTGFDWQVPFGADVIAATFAARSEFRLERTVRTPLYRIDLFRRVDDDEAGAPVAPLVEDVKLGSALESRVERQVIWNGPIATRAGIASRRAFRIPVLMYHRVAETGPASLAPYRVSAAAFEAQLIFLRRRGFRSVGLADWRRARRTGSIEGRPILMTFDDAYTDFHDVAWPLLRRYDFSAHVFVPTGKVGSAADWDREAGEPAPIMDWAQIEALATEGVTFGSHLASHPAADCLASADLLREAVRSRLMLETVTGREVTSIAAPFGAADSRTDGIFRLAGYREGFRVHGGPARVWELGLATPRIEIPGGLDLHAFAERLGVPVEPPDGRDRVPA